MSGVEYSCVFCDDVRHEIGGKFSFIGTYVNDLVISAKDADDAVLGLPKFFIVCFLKNTDKRKRYSILIEQPGVDKKKGDIEGKAIKSDEKAIFIFEMSPFTIPKAGSMKVSLTTGKDKMKIGELKLIVNKLKPEDKKK